VLDRFGLADVADRRVSTYSGGMRRRLDLSASLVGRPPVMLLDEPTTGLDPRTRQELWGTVAELRDEGTTVLLTTQYLEEADHLAGRIAVVDHGRIVAEGTPEELKRQLAGEMLYVRLAEPAQTAAAAEALGDLAEDERPVADGAEGTVHFGVVDASASAEVVRRMDARGIAIAAIELREPSLDDVFMALTGHPAAPQETAGGPEEIAGEAA
jgi:ABC-2 type transport system ATP-binding protein